jgi:endogenous inhibitor of DNA gyrase (YacG/DUF329 family)
MTTQIKCPRCGTLTSFSSENKFRPFCSERCQLIDLGSWASGSYKIASTEPLTEDAVEVILQNSSDNPEKVKKS